MRAVSECKTAAKKFLHSNLLGLPRFWFDRTEGNADHARCDVTGARLEFGDSLHQVDIAVGGGPCQPFIELRDQQDEESELANVSGSGGGVPAHRHRLFGATMHSMVKFLKLNRPRCGVYENVLGWDSPQNIADQDTSWMRVWIMTINDL